MKSCLREWIQKSDYKEDEMKKVIMMPWCRDYSQLEEVQLVKKAMKQDDLAFLELMKRYEGYFTQIAYRYVKNDQEVLDLIQELAYKGLLTIGQLKEPKYFKTWMTKILMNLALDSIQKVDFLELDEGMMKHHHVFSIEEKIDLHEAIKNLRPEYQSVIHLKYFDDLSIEEIATQLGMSSNTIKSHLRRGKRELRLMLKEESC